jgi:hypothetical protein
MYEIIDIETEQLVADFSTKKAAFAWLNKKSDPYRYRVEEMSARDYIPNKIIFG